MIKINKYIAKYGLIIVSVLFGIILFDHALVRAEEKGSLEYKTVHSYQEMMDYIETDEFFFKMDAISKEENGASCII